MQDYRKLIAWQKAHAVALEVHTLTDRWSRRENAGLTGQMRRAALSIPSNIAEGAGRKGDKDFAKFIQVAIGSAVELEYQLEFAAARGLIGQATLADVQGRVVEVRRILYGLSKRLRS